jgi:hypothetical protein
MHHPSTDKAPTLSQKKKSILGARILVQSLFGFSSAEPSDAPTIRVTSRLVYLDVTVLNKKVLRSDTSITVLVNNAGVGAPTLCIGILIPPARERDASIYRTSLDSLEPPQMAFQVLSLFLIALPIASIAWTITHEEVVREFRDLCLGKSTTCRKIYERKFFYLFTCEYCFSHYVTAVFLIVTRFKLLYPDWRGYLIAGFALVWVANVYMSLFARIRLEVKRERVQIKKEEKGVE